MDFKQLEVFVAVAKYSSFSKAAKELYLTQPTVSSHIQKLETELDTMLVNRSNKSVTLTPSGKVLYDNAIVILNSCKKAVYSLKEYSGKIEGTIDLVCSSIPETYLLPKFLTDFINEYPDVKYNISHHDSKEAIEDILEDRVSFGLVGSKISNSQIKYVELYDDELVIIAPPDLEIKNRDGAVNIKDLTEQKWIMRKEGSGTRELIVKTLAKHKLSENNLNIVAHIESHEAIKSLVKNGTGISLVSKMSVLEDIEHGKIKSYTVRNMKFSRKFYLVFNKNKSLSPLENKFYQNIIDHFVPASSTDRK